MKKIRKIRNKKKAQIFSIDLIVAIIIFITILLASIWLWDYSREKIYLTEKRADIEMITRTALSVLVETPGSPANWTYILNGEFDPNTINSLGLAKSSSLSDMAIETQSNSAGLTPNNYLVLDDDKVGKFEELTNQRYAECKKILGIMGPNYEYQLDVRMWNGEEYSSKYTIGPTPSPLSRHIVRADRFALIEGERANLVFKVWQECSGLGC